jgi:coenzyme F420-dependent glucose-6-phosphate dehydrogenase
MTCAIGYRACHERYQPTKLLEDSVLAERWGFESVWASDHFHPWAHTSAAGSFAWTWMASVAERTKRMKIGTSVTAPILRYHPAIVAQAFATLGFMYPHRIFLGLGAGEALNESPLGYTWPSPRQRIEMLEEAIAVIRKLWSEEFVSFEGKYYRLKKANLYTKPSKAIKILVAAGGPRVAELAGRLADGIIVPPASPERSRTLLQAFERGASRTGRSVQSLERMSEVTVSYDEDYEEALKGCRFWAGSMLPMFYKYDVSDPREIEAHGEYVGNEVLSKEFIVATTADEHIRKVKEYIKRGFNRLAIASASPDEERFIEFYGTEVLPHLSE